MSRFSAVMVVGLGMTWVGAVSHNYTLVGGGTAITVLAIIWDSEDERNRKGDDDGKKGKAQDDEDGEG